MWDTKGACVAARAKLPCAPTQVFIPCVFVITVQHWLGDTFNIILSLWNGGRRDRRRRRGGEGVGDRGVDSAETLGLCRGQSGCEKECSPHVKRRMIEEAQVRPFVYYFTRIQFYPLAAASWNIGGKGYEYELFELVLLLLIWPAKKKNARYQR